MELALQALLQAQTPSLPGLRQELRLLSGEPQADGVPAWRIHDPVRNLFFDIGWIEFELLARWREGITNPELIEAVAACTPLRPTADELETLVSFLDHHQLLAASNVARRDQLRRRSAAGKPSWWLRLLHSYLFFRVPLLRPDAWLDRIAPRMTWLFGKTFITITLISGCAGIYLATRQSNALATAFGYFFNLEGLLSYAIAASIAKMIHEFGHALASKQRGLRVPTMGLAFLVLMPVLYTDTSESWKLLRRRDRFAVAAAGIGLELMLAAWTTLAWALIADGPLRSGLFLLATTTWLWTLAVNASPFMRFDGYFLLSDMIGVPNLHERSFALAKHMLRKTLFGYEDSDPEPGIDQTTKRSMIMFALATWIYRLVLFLGIAVAVYNLFFKLLGLVLFAVEVGWFLVRPVWSELREVARQRTRWQLRARPWLMIATGLAGLAWLLTISHQVSAPALARAAQESTMFSPASARVVSVAVTAGQEVHAGDVLLRLESPELAIRAERARLRGDGYAVELSRASAGQSQLERRLMTEEQLGEALADVAGAQAEMTGLTLRAPHDGRIFDLPADLVAGRWVNQRHPLLRVVNAKAGEIEAYLDESQIGAVALKQTVHFYPNAPSFPVVQGTIVAIDSSARRVIPHPLLASLHGGGIAATQTGRDTLIAHEAVYRVRVQLAPEAEGFSQVVQGRLRVEANWLAIGLAGVARVASVIVRETGF